MSFFLFRQSITWVGLSFHDSAIRLLKVKSAAKKLYVEDYAVEALLPGFVKNGKILQPEKIIELIRQLVKKTHSQNYDTVIAIPYHQVIIKPLKLAPYLSDQECWLDINANLMDYLPDMKEELTIHLSRSTADGDILVAARTDYINSFIHLLHEAKLKLKKIDVDIYALTRILNAVIQDEDQIVLEVEEHSVHYLFIQAGKIMFHHYLVCDGPFYLFSEAIIAQLRKMLQQIIKKTSTVIWLSGDNRCIKKISHCIPGELIRSQIFNPFKNMCVLQTDDYAFSAFSIANGAILGALSKC